MLLTCKKSTSLPQPEQVQLPSEMTVAVITAAIFAKATGKTKSKGAGWGHNGVVTTQYIITPLLSNSLTNASSKGFLFVLFSLAINRVIL